MMMMASTSLWGGWRAKTGRAPAKMPAVIFKFDGHLLAMTLKNLHPTSASLSKGMIESAAAF